MTNLNLKNVDSYSSAMRFLDGRRERPLAYATRLVNYGPHVEVIHHTTAIIKYMANGDVEIRNHGYLSRTTSDRLHRMTPAGVQVSFAAGGSVNSPKYTGSQPYNWTRVA